MRDGPFLCRELRLVFRADRVVGVLPASDDYFTVGEWMRDPEVWIFFKDQDLARGRERLGWFDVMPRARWR